MQLQLQQEVLQSLVSRLPTTSLTTLCSALTFTPPSLFGADTLSINASIVTGYSTTVLDTYWFNHPTTTITNATFGNVPIAYTHPGQNDYINVNI